MNDIILTDVDGVLLNWETAFRNWLWKRRLVESPLASYEDMMSLENHYDCVAAFNHSEEIRYLPPYRDAVKYVRKLHFGHGFVFHAVSNLTENAYSANLRVENLKALFGSTVFINVECLPIGSSKRPSLEPYIDSGIFWIEDKPEAAELGLELDLIPIVMKGNRNKNWHNPDIPKVRNWQEIYSMIT